MNYYEHHLGDYAQATAHLTFVEDAAYSRMLRKYYAEEKPLPADLRAVQRLVGARTDDEREAVEVVLAEFFTLQEDGWHNKRADDELARVQVKRDKARRSAEARWNPNASGNDANASDMACERNANASAKHDERNALQSPDTSNQKPEDQELPPSGVEVGKPTPPADLAKRSQERLRQVAEEARLAFNAKLGKPNGLLASVRLLTPDRIGQVKRCLTVARAICQAQYGVERVTEAFWADYFDAAAGDDFHAGRQAGGPGHENWQPDFEYLTRPAVMSKLFDRAMADEPAAASGGLL